MTLAMRLTRNGLSQLAAFYAVLRVEFFGLLFLDYACSPFQRNQLS